MGNRFSGWLLFILLCFIWGSSFILMKFSREALTPAQIAGLRIFSAGVFFLLPAVIYFKKIPVKYLGTILLIGFLGNLFPAFLFALAITKLHSGLSGILNALTPVIVVVIGVLFFKLPVNRRKWLGVLLGFTGMFLLSLTQPNIRTGNLGYALLIVLATISYGLNINLYNARLKHLPALAVTSVALAGMAIPVFFILWQQGFFNNDFSNPVFQKAVLEIAALGVAGSAIATWLFYLLVKKAGALFGALVTYGIPFVALFWGFLDGEPIGYVTVLCLLFILAGVYIANLPDSSTPYYKNQKL